jgi:hypothetical protein
MSIAQSIRFNQEKLIGVLAHSWLADDQLAAMQVRMLQCGFHNMSSANQGSASGATTGRALASTLLSPGVPTRLPT